ncbi:MAG: hypothetical protein ACM3VT_00520, partial [Solirubrobacterales bacterium]
ITHAVGPATLAEMTENRPFDAVIVGVEPPRFAFLEEPLRQLVPADWQREIEGGLQVQTRP